MIKRCLYIIRGLPGSGKSTLAGIISETTGDHHFEADMFFVDKRGNYRFDASKLRKAHEWCQEEVRKVLASDMSVIVSNTFTTRWEMQPYLDMAEEFDVNVVVYECKNNFGSIHNTPEDAIERMRERWEEIEL